jgi:hypothetical protein
VPMLTAQRGSISVRPRHPETREVLADREPVEFPIGEDLLHAVRERYDFGITHESNAIRRYAGSMGIDLRDVIDEYLDGEELGRMQVQRFLTNTGLRPLFSPIVEDGLRLGLNRVAAVWSELIARNIPVPTLTYEYYEFDNGEISGGAPATPSSSFAASAREPPSRQPVSRSAGRATTSSSRAAASSGRTRPSWPRSTSQPSGSSRSGSSSAGTTTTRSWTASSTATSPMAPTTRPSSRRQSPATSPSPTS